MRYTERLAPGLVQGFMAGDPYARLLIGWVIANADQDVFGGDEPSAMLASHVKPLQDLDPDECRSLSFGIETSDPSTEEAHSYVTTDEDEWRAVAQRLNQQGWEFTVNMEIVIDDTGGPRSFSTTSPHIKRH